MILRYFNFMKNIYNITKGQVYTLWVFGFLSTFWALSMAESGSGMGIFFAILIPSLIFFYTLGWGNANKKQ